MSAKQPVRYENKYGSYWENVPNDVSRYIDSRAQKITFVSYIVIVLTAMTFNYIYGIPRYLILDVIFLIFGLGGLPAMFHFITPRISERLMDAVCHRYLMTGEWPVPVRH